MKYNNLPIVVRDIIFNQYIKIIYNHREFIDELMKARCIDKEFKYKVDKLLKKFFTCRDIFFYRDLFTIKDTRSVFLKDRLDKYYRKNNFILFEKDLNHRLICSVCSVILDSECFLVDKTVEERYPVYSSWNYILEEATCWECYKNTFDSRISEYHRLENNIEICEKVFDFVNSIIL